ncbi:hypothetical protein OCK74_17725 [Chitinophagaceae bacterium LB-8]|uniref:Uncharacterized protein n=1 Tax=Paraflavisolibacter caeni TaxID=2982496 RepID=A0A9X2XPC5_9BACT|nr:hypothetical protein [Paraflavisolibacter caeni]MCU7550963.1 hypothetical protein [Paraflavisolibacter caeni]
MRKTTLIPFKGVYKKHPFIKGHYELDNPKEFQFNFLVISRSKADYLRNIGANAVINCFNGKTKILHSGLIECYNNWYFGDTIYKSTNKTFIVLRHLPERKELILYLFQSFYPKRPFEFARKFIYRILLKEKAT